MILLFFYSCAQSQNKKEKDFFYNFREIIEKQNTDIKIGNPIENENLLHLLDYKKGNYALKYGYKFNIKNIKCVIYFISYPAQVPIEVYIATFIENKKIENKKIEGLILTENTKLIYESNEVLFMEKQTNFQYIIDKEGKINSNKNIDTLQELFTILPDSVVFNLSKKERLNVLKCKKPDNSACNHFWTNIVDEKNGYLNIKGSFEGSWEMTYWKNSKNEIMIGVNHIGCGPACYNIYTYFYLYKDKSLSSHLLKLPILKASDFFNEPTLSKVLKETQNINIVFRLPQKGTTIIGELEPLVYSEFMNQSKYNMVELQWNGDKGFKSILRKKY